MKRAYVVTGTLSDAHSVALDEPVTLPSDKVRLVIEPLDSSPDLQRFEETPIEVVKG